MKKRILCMLLAAALALAMLTPAFAADEDTPDPSVTSSAAPSSFYGINETEGLVLKWTAVRGAESYVIYRDGKQIGATVALTLTDKRAVSGTEYTYSVTALVDGTESEPAYYRVMRLDSPQNIRFEVGSNGITVSWDPVPGANRYRLDRRSDTDYTRRTIWNSTKPTTSKLDKDVKDGMSYEYYVTAIYKSEDGTMYCSSGTASAKIVCNKSGVLKTPVIKSISNGFSSILVKWTRVTSAEGYHVYRKAEGGEWKLIKDVPQTSYGSSPMFGNTTPKNGELYTYKVVAYCGDMLSEESNEKSYMRLTCPTLKAKSRTAGKISFSWTDNEAATSFQIEYTTDETFTGATRKTLTDYKTSTAYTGLTSGRKYQVRVRPYLKYWNETEGKYMFYYGTWSSADTTGSSTLWVTVK